MTESEVEALGSAGFFLRDDFIDVSWGRALWAIAQARFQGSQLNPAGIGRGAHHHISESVRSDFITWLDDHDEEEAVRRLWQHFEALRIALNTHAWLGLTRFELQLACYPGGGSHYAAHRDAFLGDDNRRVTAIAYLNPGWKTADGGVLRLHTEPAVDVEPQLGRGVIFLSQKVEHEVLPSWAPRFAVTAWYSAR